MGLVFRRRVQLTRHLSLNVSTSGVSVSARVGRVTANSRGRVSVRVARGLSYRRRFF